MVDIERIGVHDAEPEAREYIKQKFLNPNLSDDLKESLAWAITHFVREGYMEGNPISEQLKGFLHPWDASFVHSAYKDACVADFIEKYGNMCCQESIEL